MTTETKTLKEQIENAIEIEADEPAATILKVLKENDGRRLDVHLLRKINKALDYPVDDYWNGVRKTTLAGMTHLEWGKTYAERTSMLVCYQTVNVFVDAAKFEDHNPGYYGAKDARNESRSKITADKIQELIFAATQLEEARERLQTLVDADCFDADSCTLEHIVGLRQPR